MKRTKRFTLRRIVLGLAVAAILAPVAHAKPTPVDHDKTSMGTTPTITLGAGEIPYTVEKTLTIGPGEIPSYEDDIAWPSSKQGMPPTVADDGGYDVGFGVAGSAAMLLLIAVAGSVVAVRRVRRTRLAPA